MSTAAARRICKRCGVPLKPMTFKRVCRRCQAGKGQLFETFGPSERQSPEITSAVESNRRRH
jgi:hypothetical protein